MGDIPFARGRCMAAFVILARPLLHVIYLDLQLIHHLALIHRTLHLMLLQRFLLYEADLRRTGTNSTFRIHRILLH